MLFVVVHLLNMVLRSLKLQSKLLFNQLQCITNAREKENQQMISKRQNRIIIKPNLLFPTQTRKERNTDRLHRRVTVM